MKVNIKKKRVLSMLFSLFVLTGCNLSSIKKSSNDNSS